MADIAPAAGLPTQGSTLDRVARILTDVLDLEPGRVTADTDMVEDLGADSLDVIEIVMAAEEEFGIQIHDGEEAGADTVADFVALVDRKAGRA